MKKVFIGLAAFLTVLAFGFESARACSCVRSATCEFSGRASAVFVGKVLDSRVEERNYSYSDDPQETPIRAKFQISRVAVREAFFGIENEREIEIETDNFSSCFFSLENGVEHLIYASRDEKSGKYSTGFCSGTKPVEIAGEDLDYLRAQKNATGATVKGFVAFNPKNSEYLTEVPRNNFAALANLGISTVLLENESEKFTAKIENDGTYAFSNVPRGKYKLSVVLPKGFGIQYAYNPVVAKELGIELGAVETRGPGCTIEDLTVFKTRFQKKRRK